MKSKITKSNNCQACLVGRFSFPHVFTPHSAVPGAEARYSISLLVPKTDQETIAVISEAIENALQKGDKREEWGPGGRPQNLTYPIKDGDQRFIKDKSGKQTAEVDPHYAGHWYLDAKSYSPIQVFDQSKGTRVAVEPNDPNADQVIYGGAYGALDVMFAPYAAGINKGVTIYLSRVLKLSDGEPFGSRAPIAEVFGEDEDESFLD